MEVEVRNNDVEWAIRRFRTLVGKDGTVRKATDRAKGLYRKKSVRLRAKHRHVLKVRRKAREQKERWFGKKQKKGGLGPKGKGT